MNDILFVGLTLLFFALTFGLLAICDRLMENK
ncbi:MAG: hypothetical protein CNIPEHKO_02412 [Anaerolineales bacterium]|nr:potassium ABC transporter ATPase [Anaerolineae bacterium]MBV6402108.1 hypothetical protein [Anaerolineales bacterium]